MKDINIKSIRYPVTVDQKLEKLALKFGRTKRLFFTQMVNYFYKSQKDPSDLNDEVLQKEVANGINRIISFIRTQEKDFLLPVSTDTKKLIQIASNHSKHLDGINRYTHKDEQQTKEIIIRIALVEQAITKTQVHLEQKMKLIDKAIEILEYYIHHREKLGWPASSAKKKN